VKSATRSAGIGLGRGFGGHHIAVGAGLGHRPVELEAVLGLGQILHLQQLMRELVQRIHAVLGLGARMRCLARDLEVGGADAAGGQAQAAVGAAAFKAEHGVLLGPQAVMVLRAPGELISSSPLISTVSVP
jgi:hypothetical protein